MKLIDLENILNLNCEANVELHNMPTEMVWMVARMFEAQVKTIGNNHSVIVNRRKVKLTINTQSK